MQLILIQLNIIIYHTNVFEKCWSGCSYFKSEIFPEKLISLRCTY